MIEDEGGKLTIFSGSTPTPGKIAIAAGGTLSDQINSLVKQMTEKVLPSVARESARQLFNLVVDFSPPIAGVSKESVGVFVSEWKVSSGSPEYGKVSIRSIVKRKTYHRDKRATADGEAEKQAKKEEINAFFSSITGNKNPNFFLTNDLPYANKVENTGWGSTGPYKPVGKALQRLEDIVRLVVEERMNGIF